MRFPLAATLALCLAGSAMAAPLRKPPPLAEPLPVARGTAAETIAALPEQLGLWKRGAMTDFASRGTGLGISVEYRPLRGGSGVATVFAYDRGQPPLRDGIVAPEVAAELAAAQQEISTLAPYRAYQVTATGGDFVVAGPDGRPGLRCETTLLAFAAGPAAEAFTCLGVHHGRFLKLRLTLRAAAPGENAAIAQGFASDLLAVAR